jgi:hypothetical protein
MHGTDYIVPTYLFCKILICFQYQLPLNYSIDRQKRLLRRKISHLQELSVYIPRKQQKLILSCWIRNASKMFISKNSIIFQKKKSDALVGRVNTFITLHTKWFKTEFKFGIYRRPLNLQISKFSFSHSESEFVWKVSLGLKIFEFWICSYLLNAKVLCSMEKFVEKNWTK